MVFPRSIRRLKIMHQAVMMLVLIVSAIVSTFLFWAADNTRSAELAQSRTVADMADSMRAMVSGQSGHGVRQQAAEDAAQAGRYLGTYPAGVTARFRLTSDNVMNAANQPDLFDLEALQTMRVSGVKEYWKVQNGQLRYARALRADKACLACHGHPDQAPAVVRMTYRPPVGQAKGGGYGYALDEVVGVTSVALPHTGFGAMLLQQSWGFWLSVCVVLGLTGVVFWQLMRGVVVPLSRLSRYAADIAQSENLAQVRQPKFDADEASSHNEIHQQSFALKALHESMRSAVDHITRNGR